MTSSSSNIVDGTMEGAFEQYFEETIEKSFENMYVNYATPQEGTKKNKPRTYIDRNREGGHYRLWNDYFGEDAIYPSHIFRRRFRMNKPLFMRIVDRVSNEFQFFKRKRDATGRFGFSGLQKCTTAIRMLAYGCAADAVDEYLRIGESTALSCMEHFVEEIISLFRDEYLRRPTPEDLQRLLDIGQIRGFPGMVGSIDCTLNDLNVLDRSPVFTEILQGEAPTVNYFVNGNEYHLAYYLTDGIYPQWPTFIQSIRLPQCPKASLFAQRQEAVRKDVERAFGVLQARFAIIKNHVCLLNPLKIVNIMRACIILHNMIVEDERDGYTLFDLSDFELGEGNRTSNVDLTYSTDMPTNLANLMGNRTGLRDRKMHHQLKADLVEHIW